MELVKIEEGVRYLEKKIAGKPLVGMILGSGLGGLAEEVEEGVAVPYGEVPNLSPSTAPGHAGRFVFGILQGIPVAVMQGRFHYYEGCNPQELARPVRMMAKLGIKTLLVTNASGAINKNFAPGDFMFIEDHINMMGFNPLRGPNYPLGPRFQDMTYTYDQKLIDMAEKAAQAVGKKVHRGVYAGVAGPNFETPAEIEMLRRLGADAVGMSTVPEVLTARHLGIKVLGISVASNMAAGILPETLDHEEVLAIGNRVKPQFIELILKLFSSKEFYYECG